MAHQIFFTKNRIFKFVPSPTDHRGHIGKILHECTTAFLPLYKGIKVALKFCNILVICCAQSDHFFSLFCTTLKSLTNYSAAMKSIIRKILYTCTYTITILIRCCGIFFYLSPK